MFDGITKVHTEEDLEFQNNILDIFDNCDKLFNFRNEKKQFKYQYS